MPITGLTERPNVLVVGEIPHYELERLGGATTVATVSRDQLLSPAVDPHLAAVRGLLVTGQAPVDATLLGRLPRLQVVSLRAVGYDRVDVPACTERGVAVCTTPGVLDGAVADLTALLILGIMRRRPWAAYAATGSTAAVLGHDVRGRTLGVIGMGRIGSAVARTMVAGFEMEVLYTSRTDAALFPAGERVTLEELLARSDVVTLHRPLAPGSSALIGERELSLMKPSAHLVNTSRGGLIDEPALVRALVDGRIAGAALDVTCVEPLPADHPLWSTPNVLLTPHVGSATVETRHAMAAMAVDNLLDVISGRPPRHQVN